MAERQVTITESEWDDLLLAKGAALRVDELEKERDEARQAARWLNSKLKHYEGDALALRQWPWLHDVAAASETDEEG